MVAALIRLMPLNKAKCRYALLRLARLLPLASPSALYSKASKKRRRVKTEQKNQNLFHQKNMQKCLSLEKKQRLDCSSTRPKRIVA